MTRKFARIRAYLRQANPVAFNIYAGGAAFGAYFCMYAFRKPFAAGAYAGDPGLEFLPGLELKTLFILSQALGYAFSKFYGVKFVSEHLGGGRARAILGLILAAEFFLFLFASVSGPYRAVFLFLNGLPLGMIWGLVFSYLEGRRHTEILGAILSTSFIVASGVVKSIGLSLVHSGVSEYSMPFLTGLIFLPPLFLFVGMLRLLPGPSRRERILRVRRRPMFARERREFFFAFWPGLSLLVFIYVLLTAYRDIRDNFAREIWEALGFAGRSDALAWAEIPVMFGALFAAGLIFLVRDNRRALIAILGLVGTGALIMGGAALAFAMGILPPALWMTLAGLGLYLGYVPFNSVLFDRLIAAVRIPGTAGFMIYLADALGYAGSVILLLYKDFGTARPPWEKFFLQLSYGVSAVSLVCIIISIGYFLQRTPSGRAGSL